MPHIYKIVDAMRNTGIPVAQIRECLAVLRPCLTPDEIASFEWRIENPEHL